MKNLLDNEERLSVGRYEHNFNCKLQKALRKQYLVQNNLLKDMLLSPRASLECATISTLSPKRGVEAVIVFILPLKILLIW